MRTICTGRLTGWWSAKQRIEDRLARRHLVEGELVLYDVSSSYFEGRTCELAALGYSRDQKRGTPQIIYGLLCDKPGGRSLWRCSAASCTTTRRCLPRSPSSVSGSGWPGSLSSRTAGWSRRPTSSCCARRGAGWITALKAPQIKKLVRDGALQLSLFDEQNLAEIAAEEYPGERLVVCRNPLVAAERARKRDELLAATERGLAEIADRVERGTLTGAAQIGLAVGPALKRYRVKKHFEMHITDTTFT